MIKKELQNLRYSAFSLRMWKATWRISTYSFPVLQGIAWGDLYLCHGNIPIRVTVWLPHWSSFFSCAFCIELLMLLDCGTWGTYLPSSCEGHIVPYLHLCKMTPRTESEHFQQWLIRELVITHTENALILFYYWYSIVFLFIWEWDQGKTVTFRLNFLDQNHSFCIKVVTSGKRLP